jgi:hypothetical protein
MKARQPGRPEFSSVPDNKGKAGIDSPKGSFSPREPCTGTAALI